MEVRRRGSFFGVSGSQDAVLYDNRSRLATVGSEFSEPTLGDLRTREDVHALPNSINDASRVSVRIASSEDLLYVMSLMRANGWSLFFDRRHWQWRRPE